MGTAAITIWLACATVAFAGFLFMRRSRLHRRLRLSDLDWKAGVVLAAIVGAVPAFVFDQVNHRAVEVPPDVTTTATIPR